MTPPIARHLNEATAPRSPRLARLRPIVNRLGLIFLLSATALRALPGGAVFHADYDNLALGGTGDTDVSDHAGPLVVLQQHFHPGRACLVGDGTEAPRGPGRTAGHVLRFETRQDDGDFGRTRGNRSELRLASQPLADPQNVAPREVWYAWSLFVPAPADSAAAWDGGDNAYPKLGNAKDDGDGGGREVYFQVHAPDGIDLQGNAENPPLALYRLPDARFPGTGRLDLVWRWDVNDPPQRAKADLGAFPLGRWTNFVLRVQWSNDPTAQGSVELWQDGRKVVDEPRQRVGYRNMHEMYLKFGIYAFDWNNNPAPDRYRAIAYYDEIRVSEGAFSTLAAGLRALQPQRP